MGMPMMLLKPAHKVLQAARRHPAGGNKLKRKCSRFILSLSHQYSLTLRAAQQQDFSIRSRDAKFLSRFFNP
jgi:hypothetical protein